jgi:LysM repeat protein
VTGRTLARLLAPLALVACAVALFSIVSSGTEDPAEKTGSAPTATATPKPKAKQQPKEPAGGTYVVKAGDTPLAIAEAEGVDVDDLLAANPDVDPNALTVGDELKIP